MRVDYKQCWECVEIVRRALYSLGLKWGFIDEPLNYNIHSVKHLKVLYYINHCYSYYQEVEVQLNIVKDVLFKKVQELQTETMKEKALVSEIEGTRSSLKHLNHQLHKLDFETLQQQEIMYAQVDDTLMNVFILICHNCDGQDTAVS